MKKKILFVLGGARSGKSGWALRYAETHFRSAVYVATAEVRDEEMAERVRLHRQARGSGWRLIEEPLNLHLAIERAQTLGEGILVDCLTLWLSNLLLQKGEEAVPEHEAAFFRALENTTRPVLLVANEVGMGIVPEHPLGRLFRDLAGFVNQRVAARADSVVLTVAGLPLVLKGDLEGPGE